MAGEFRIAQHCIAEAIKSAKAENSMSEEAMGRALLTELLAVLSQQHAPNSLKELIEYQLDNLSNDEFVVTRGC